VGLLRRPTTGEIGDPLDRRLSSEALTSEQEFEGTALGDQIVVTTQLLEGILTFHLQG
jgi:hypothetical protein